MDLAARFLPLLGTWTGLERLAEEAGETDAITARASLVLRLEVGGTAVVQDYRQVRADGRELTAHGVFRVSAPDLVTGWLFESTGGAPAVLTGAFDDHALELRTTDQRHLYRGAGDELEREVSQRTAAGWRRTLAGRYRRVSGH